LREGGATVTRDDIIRMAREACDADKVDAWHSGFWTLTQEELEKFAALVAAAEREACAKLCEEEAFVEQWKGLAEAAKRIRARGQQC